MIGLLAAISPRLWLTIGASIAVALAIGWAVAWVHGKDVQIHRAQAATQVAQRHTIAAVWALANSQNDTIMARVNEVTLMDAISRQNAAVQSLSAESARRLQEAAVGLARAERAHAADQQRLAVLGRPLVAATACARADEAAERAREALR